MSAGKYVVGDYAGIQARAEAFRAGMLAAEREKTSTPRTDDLRDAHRGNTVSLCRALVPYANGLERELASAQERIRVLEETCENENRAANAMALKYGEEAAAHQETKKRIAELETSEKELSDAYLRIRELLAPDAYKTTHGGSDRFAVTEEALRNRLTRIAELEAQLATLNAKEGTPYTDSQAFDADEHSYEVVISDVARLLERKLRASKAEHLATQRALVWALDPHRALSAATQWGIHRPAITAAREAVAKADKGKEGV